MTVKRRFKKGDEVTIDISPFVEEELTKKRFRLISVRGMDFDIEDNGKPMRSLSNICKELNILHEENQRYKRIIDQQEMELAKELERYEGERIVSVKDNVNDKNINIKEMVDLLNTLHEEREYWKQACLSNDGHVQILENEINIAMEQGYKLSNAYMDYRKKRFERIRELEEIIE